MAKDKDGHKEIRESVIDFIKQSYPQIELYVSHKSKGDIALYISDTNEKEIEISQPDIVCLKNEKAFLIIEIELTSTPKHLLGVIFANALSKKGKYQGKCFPVDNLPLFLIVDFKDRLKDGSIKIPQIKALENQFSRICPKYTEGLTITTDKDWKNKLEPLLKKDC